MSECESERVALGEAHGLTNSFTTHSERPPSLRERWIGTRPRGGSPGSTSKDPKRCWDLKRKRDDVGLDTVLIRAGRTGGGRTGATGAAACRAGSASPGSPAD